jgi:hypothetical protein
MSAGVTARLFDPSDLIALFVKSDRKKPRSCYNPRSWLNRVNNGFAFAAGNALRPSRT